MTAALLDLSSYHCDIIKTGHNCYELNIKIPSQKQRKYPIQSRKSSTLINIMFAHTRATLRSLAGQRTKIACNNQDLVDNHAARDCRS